MAKKNKKKNVYPVLTGLELLRDNLFAVEDVIELTEIGKFVGEYIGYKKRLNEEKYKISLQINKLLK